MYGKLYNPESKIIIRTTVSVAIHDDGGRPFTVIFLIRRQTQDRMLRSAENWAAGFFGLDW